ncbi:MAG TPA: FecR domain-containing protein [Opitutaceae bacterium]|jgi:transmembrane sensor|nr:FecR domain-containing protein [Opitutaceae bacterium]
MKLFDQNSPDHDEEVEAMAAAWLAERDDGLTPEKEAAFQQWRQASPRHEAAVARLEATWNTLLGLENFRPEAQAHPDRDLLAPARRHKPALAPVVAWSAAAAAALVLGLAGGIWWHLHPRNAPPEVYATTAESYQWVTLADGSVAELNASSEIRVDYTPAERRVQLVRGEAHFTVAKNKERPFWVQAGSVRVRAVGTAFDVRITDGEIDVLVTEGKVTLAKSETGGAAATPAPEPAHLAAGQRAIVATTDPGAIPVIENVSPTLISDVLAWQGARLVFVATPLADVVSEFNRRNPVQIELGDSALGVLPISGSFRPENVEGFVRLLAQGGDISVDRPSSDRIILRRAR